MLLRDLVTRLTFKVDSEPLRNLDKQVTNVFGGFRKLGGFLAAGFSISAGASFEFVTERFKTMLGKGVKPFREEMERLQKETGGLFTPRALMEAGIGAAAVGLQGKEAAEALHLASRFLVRSGGDIKVAMADLVQGLQTGGLGEVFQKWAVMTPQVKDAVEFFESKIAAAGAGTPIGKELVRRYSRSLADAFRSPEAKQKLDKAFAEFLDSPAAEMMRSQALLKTTWDRLSDSLVKGLVPAVRALNDVFISLNKSTAAFGGIEGVVKEVSSSIAELFKGEINPKSIKGLTYGGFLMFLYSRNPIWLGVGLGGLMGQGLESLGDWIRGMRKERQEEYLNAFERNYPGAEEIRAQPKSFGQEELESAIQRRGQMQKQLSLPSPNFRMGDVNINMVIPGGMNAEEIAQRTYDKFTDAVTQVGVRYIRNLEVGGIG